MCPPYSADIRDIISMQAILINDIVIYELDSDKFIQNMHSKPKPHHISFENVKRGTNIRE